MESNDLDARLDEIKQTLMKDNRFAAAKAALRRLYQDHPGHIKLAQQLAICTYKDAETPPAQRYAEALEVLESVGLGQPGCEPETLRLGGAVYKRLWQFNGRLENLHHAYGLYREAAETDPDDQGYGGVNAAYILDLLSARARVQARKTATSEREAVRLADKARRLRERIIADMNSALEEKPELADDIWFSPTIAEAYFGLGIYDAANFTTARDYIERAVDNGLDEWEAKTSFRQLVSIAKAQGIPLPVKQQRISDWPPAWQVMTAYLGEDTPQALECYRGRVGLALSGGGFRASFYHLGVLARLAEMDVLRSVEVLSTVSGGSIVGAHYYLEVQHLLKHKSDREIGREDYIEIVARVQRQFFAGVSKNLRMRTFANPLTNIAMIFDEKYSRSRRIGTLYERDLYSNIGNDQARTDCEIQPRSMADLMIHPRDRDDGSFNPNQDNWKRLARAPVLLLNTTSLNSGHNWRFTASWMGEPPGVMDDKIDKNTRYQWMRYTDPGVPPVRLGDAVAASACVPGLFEPLALPDLYPDHTIRLVDGGVHDNQGVAGLLDEGCTLVLCSDASGQMDSQAEPGATLLGVPLRANSILMDRVREAQYQDLATRVDSRALEGLFFTHLKDGLDADRVTHDGAAGKADSIVDGGYGIHPEIQRRIAALRTDLDCFTEVEANALMLSGYQMTKWHFSNLQTEHLASGEAGTWGDYDIGAPSRDGYWSFLDADFVALAGQEPSSENPGSKRLAALLDIGAGLFFKVFRAVKPLRIAGFGLLLAIAAALVGLIYRYWDHTLFSTTVGQTIAAVTAFVLVMLWPVFKWLNPQSALRDNLMLLIVGVGGAFASLVQVYLLDGFFLRAGSLEKLKSFIRG